KAIQEGFTKYTDVGGINELKDAIIDKLKRDNGLEYQRSEILVSNGGKHSLYNIAQALYNPGDEILIPTPYRVSYHDQTLLNDAAKVLLHTDYQSGFIITDDQLDQAITPNTKAIIINSPSNPTGSAYTREELLALAEVIIKHQIICISDEIYEKI